MGSDGKAKKGKKGKKKKGKLRSKEPAKWADVDLDSDKRVSFDYYNNDAFFPSHLIQGFFLGLSFS
jgi:hypothetical protein